MLKTGELWGVVGWRKGRLLPVKKEGFFSHQNGASDGVKFYSGEREWSRKKVLIKYWRESKEII